MKQILIITIWLILFAGTTVFLVADWLLSLVLPKGKKKPYFKPRSIFCED